MSVSLCVNLCVATQGKMGSEWANVAKAAVAKLILSLTTINESLRNAVPCLESHQVRYDVPLVLAPASLFCHC